MSSRANLRSAAAATDRIDTRGFAEDSLAAREQPRITERIKRAQSAERRALSAPHFALGAFSCTCQNMHNVPVLHDVSFPFETVDAMALRLFHGADALEIFEPDNLGTY